MGAVKSVRCNNCGFQLLWGLGGTPYIRKYHGPIRRLLGMHGKKILLEEPAEMSEM